MRRLLLCAVLIAPLVLAARHATRDQFVAAPVPSVAHPISFQETLEPQPVTSRAHVHRTLLPFAWPAKGSITGVYGNDGGRRHPGIDIGILRSPAVRAAAPGRVVRTGYVRGYEGYGKVVLARSGKYLVLYAHLSRVGVKRGQLIEPGRRLGLAGCTGWCTGTHLHFEVRRGHRTLNPMRLLATAR